MAAANGLTVGPSEAETFWTEYLRSLKARGLNGLKVVICDAPAGLKAAIRRVFNQPDQKRCCGHLAAPRRSAPISACRSLRP